MIVLRPGPHRSLSASLAFWTVLRTIDLKPPLRCRRMSDDVVSTFGVLRARTTTVQAPNPGASGMRAAVALLSPGRGIELHQTCRICILTVSHLTGLLCKDHSTSSYLDERQPDSRQVTRLQTSGQVAGALM